MPDFQPVLALHGGAGTIRRTAMTPEREAAYTAGLLAALSAGREVLEAGGTALDAVTATVMALEDEPLFNAGRGAVLTSAGTLEMDAAIMDGRDRRAGAVAGIFGPRNPILAARAVMEKTEHVMLTGSGANAFCREIGLEIMPEDYFLTSARQEALARELERRRTGAPDDGDAARKHGTVGAVALDCHGHLAAATSTGGMTAKLPGRVGDSPVFGAGTWADDATCAVSATGHGEYFIRYAVGHEIDARMRWAGQSLKAASEGIVRELAPLGGSGGLIAVDRTGAISLPFNSEGMYRAWMQADGSMHTAIF
ncbi:L-asparaginase/beta-aspartyl-peptidase (threonine type) [Azorhizobium sp. AG788]|uniref:isoaspartyl peptidase/L-asparaginase family protein n=1 Tax=Azorhizobium sp. AG788 TaxID=2183897 RepID=UPI00105F817A|nr:isoaspartyl peptidase/L-asparaginase [Azorhizobium sp. AG788]TDT93442.1 L-asparaginase/beta-aspartyl-peptidase (threonine type) [Azorhizobium sp. AG788]